jgi:hypothetical protein
MKRRLSWAGVVGFECFGRRDSKEDRDNNETDARAVWLAALVLAGGCASSGEISKVEAAKVRVVTETEMVRGCQVLGTVADNELEDLQRKAAKLGGNVALLTPQRTSKGGYFGLQDYKTADVYKCEGR